MFSQNIFDTYYSVGGEIYSTKTNTYVLPDNPDWQAWAEGNPQGPPNMADEADLWETVQRLGRGHPPWMFDGATFVQPDVDRHTPTQLHAYAAEVRWQAEVTGSSGGVAYATDRLSRTLMSTTLLNIRANNALTVEWKALDNTFTTLTAAEMETLNTDINAHVELCFATEKDVKADIDVANITQITQIDAAFEPLRQLPWKESYRKGL